MLTNHLKNTSITPFIRFSGDYCIPGRFARNVYTSGTDLTVMAVINSPAFPSHNLRGNLILSKRGYSPNKAIHYCHSFGGEMFKPLNSRDLMMIKEIFSSDYKGTTMIFHEKIELKRF